MKKIYILLLIVFLLILVACKNEHVHNYEYVYNDEIHYKKCECGDKTNEEVHSLSLLSYDENYEYYKCKKCGYRTQNSHDLISVDTATCYNEGIKYQECKNCSFESEEIISEVLKHHYKIDEKSIVMPTYEETGSMNIVCSNDKEEDHIIKYELRILYSYYFWSKISSIDPTCTEYGNVIYNINLITFKDDLKDVYNLSDEEISEICENIPSVLYNVEAKTDPFGHDYSKYLITIEKKPTLSLDGLLTIKCEKCDHKESLVLKPLSDTNFYNNVDGSYIVKDSVIYEFYKNVYYNDQTIKAMIEITRDLYKIN